MKQYKKIFLPILTCTILSCCNASQSREINVSIPETQRLLIENTDFDGNSFREAYMSKDLNQRRLAEMYLIGVLDASEGKYWCNYSLALPGSIQEQIYVGFKRETTESLNRRASDVIISILKKKLPCKD